MQRALTSTELNILRKHPQSTTWYLAVHSPGIIYRGDVASAPTDYPVSAINLTSVTGSSALVSPGMTVWVNKASLFPGGSDKGRARVRKAMSNSSTIEIAESGCGLINWQAGDQIAIMDQRLPWAKHPKYDTSASQWRMDYDIVYSDEFTNYPPIAQLGAGKVLIINGDNATGSFAGDHSHVFDGATSTAASWVFPNGSTTTSIGTSSTPIAIDFASPILDGEYYSLKVTDSNGNSHTGYRLLFVIDDLSKLPSVDIVSINGGLRKGGYETTISVFGSSLGRLLSNRSEFFIFEVANYNDTASEIGGNDELSANILFRGWIDDGTAIIRPFDSSATFKGATIHSTLNNAHSYDVFMSKQDNVTGASHWVEAPSLTLNMVARHIYQNRSTIGDLTDVHFPTGLADNQSTILFQSLPRSTLWNQLNQNYGQKGLLGIVSSDLQSQIWASEDVQISGGSDSLPVAMRIENQDKIGAMTINERRVKPTAHLEMLTITSTTPIGAEAPGDVAGYWGGKKSIPRGLVVDSQDTLITRTGNNFAYMNMEIDKVGVQLAGNIRLDPVPQHMVELSTAASDNVRGFVWNNKKFLQNDLTLNYRGAVNYAQTIIDVEDIAQGIGGSSMTFPTVVSLPPTTPPTGGGGTSTPPGQGDGFGTVYAATSGEVWRTRDFSASPPVWTDITTSKITVGTIADFILDPWSPSTNGYILTSNGVFKSTTLNQTSPSWELVYPPPYANFSSSKIVASINQQDYVGFGGFTWTGGEGSYTARWYYSEDGGDTWTTGYLGTSCSNAIHALDIVPHTVSGSLRIYLAVQRRLSSSNRPVTLWRSDDKGATWSIKDTPTNSGAFTSGHRPTSMHCPYSNNEDGQELWWTIRQDSQFSPADTVRHSTDGGGTNTDISTGYDEGCSVQRHGIETYTQDENRIYFWNDDEQLVVNENFGTESWVLKSATGMSGNISAAGGFPYNNSQYYIGTSTGVFVSTDAGDTFVDKTGNITITSSVRVVVPLWTE